MQHTIRPLGCLRPRPPARAGLIEQRHNRFWRHAPAPTHVRDRALPARDIDVGDVDVCVKIADRRMAAIWRRHQTSVRASRGRVASAVTPSRADLPAESLPTDPLGPDLGCSVAEAGHRLVEDLPPELDEW